MKTNVTNVLYIQIHLSHLFTVLVLDLTELDKLNLII